MLGYLTTDTQVLGIVAWISGVLTLAGLVAAIVQATRARRAAEAARVAANGMIKTVQKRESLVELIAAQSHLKSAKDSLGRSNLETGTIYTNLLRTALVEAREMMRDDPPAWKLLGNLISRLASVIEILTELSEIVAEKRDTLPSVLELTKIGSILDEIAARRRHGYEAEGVNR